MTEDDKPSISDLIAAIRKDDIDEVKRLLDAGAPIESSPEDLEEGEGWLGDEGVWDDAPIHYAAGRGNIDIVRLLLEHGADVHARDEIGDSVLHWACEGGHAHVAELLLERHADPDYIGPQSGLAPLHQTETPAVCEVLLRHGANIELEVEGAGAQGDTPLIHAAGEGYAEAFIYLAEHGANIDAKNYFGGTALDEVLHLRPDIPARETMFEWYREHHPKLALEGVLRLPPEDPLREKTLDWYREHHPELVMERYVSGPGPRMG